MKVSDVILESIVDEAKMNPSSFANAIEEGGSKGVLVGFEFEVCVPEKTIRAVKSSDDSVMQRLQKAFRDTVGFTHIEYSRVNGSSDVITPATMDRLLRPRENMDPAYATFSEAVKAIPRNERGYRSDYNDVVRMIFPNTGTSRIERNLNTYFEVLNARKLYQKLIDFDLIYDDSDEEDNGDYQGAVAVLEPAVRKAMNSEVKVFDSYHQASKDTTTWYIEPDGSLYPTDPKDGTAEVVSPPLPANKAMDALKNFYAMARDLKLYTSADNSTGLHINVSIPGSLDVLKLAVFLGEDYVLKYFGREDNEYVRSVISSLSGYSDKNSEFYKQKASRKKNKVYPGRQNTSTKIDYRALKSIVDMQTGDHFASISNNGKYISFRHAGGDYLNDYNGILNVVGRFVRAMIIASDPNLYREEYLKKLTKLFGAPKAQVSPKLDRINKIKTMINTIKTEGLPVLQFSMFSKSSRVNWLNNLTSVIYYIGRTGRIYKYFDVDNASIEKNSQIAKDTILSALWENDKQEFQKQPVGRYALATIMPNIDELDTYYKNKADGERIIWTPLNWTNNDSYPSVAQVNTLPFSDPRVQEYYKQLIRSLSVNESREYPENPIYYFAYGMLTDPKHMKGLEMVGVAELPNFEYKLYQFANVEPKGGSKVYGTLWAIDRNVLSQLDKVEGYPELYDRRTYPVYVDGDKYVAEVYVMTPMALRYSKGTKPKREYLQSIARGYLHAGVPTEQIQKALRGE